MTLASCTGADCGWYSRTPSEAIISGSTTGHWAPPTVTHAPYPLRFRPPLGAPQARGAEPPRLRTSSDAGMIIERDVAVRLRDGVEIYVDVFRPENGQRAAPIIGWGPYGKH